MTKSDHIELEGTVIHCGNGGIFKVRCDNDHIITAHISGKMRKNHIRVYLGDRVVIAVTPYDSSRGILVFRKK